MADTNSLRVRQGDTFRQSVVYGGSSPVNLTGYTFEFHVAVGDQVNTYTSAPEVALGGSAASGRIDLVLSDDQTALFTTRTGRYYLKVHPPNGDSTTLLVGDVLVDFNS